MSPSTLSAVIEGIHNGASPEVVLSQFITAFDIALTDAARYAIIEQEPALTDDGRLNALAGALAEYLAKQHKLDRVPPWASSPARCLERPWHTSSIAVDWRREYLTGGVREYLTFSSPAEFASRNIFTEEAPLRWVRRAPEIS